MLPLLEKYPLLIMTSTPAERPEYEREVNDLRAIMAETTFAKAWAEGRTLTMEQAIEYALE